MKRDRIDWAFVFFGVAGCLGILAIAFALAVVL